MCESARERAREKEKISERERERARDGKRGRQRKREREDGGRPPFQEVAVSCSYIVLKLFQSYR